MSEQHQADAYDAAQYDGRIPPRKDGATEIFKTTVVGVGPWCVEFVDGEIVTARTERRARLIAASSDLYDGCNALLGLLQLIENRCDAELLEIIRTNHRVDEAKAAVAKAEGRTCAP